MSTYTIGEVADRTGFTASALRYYEGIGLVPPAARTGAGYRVYDDHTLARLAFIARAKQLGCSLEEITDLLGIWDGERCGPVQRRFHDLVTDKIGNARRQVSELTKLTSQLQTAAAQLAGPAIDGPCGDDCACVAAAPATSSPPVPVAATPEPVAPPIACTLDDSAIPDRLAEWQALVDQARSRPTTDDGALRMEFGEEVSLAALTRLVAAEAHCCAFFSFVITVDQRGVGLEVQVPEGAEDMLDELVVQNGRA
jgi:DNA-binding transcriptional MerR regulator